MILGRCWSLFHCGSSSLPPLTTEADCTLGEAPFPSLDCGGNHPWPGPALQALAAFPDRRGSSVVYPERLGTWKGLWDLLSSSAVQEKEQSTGLSRNHRPVIVPNAEDCLCTPKPHPHSSQISPSSIGRESLFPRSQPKEEDKSALFGFHRFDPEINCQGLHDTPYQSQANCHNKSRAGCQDRLPDSCYSFILKDLDPRNQTPALKACWPGRASFSEKQKPTPAP